jgi:hypothetical protein
MIRTVRESGAIQLPAMGFLLRAGSRMPFSAKDAGMGADDGPGDR